MQEDELVDLLEHVVRRTAATLGVEDVLNANLNELLRRIALEDPETYQLLTIFSDAYLQWHRFQRGIDEKTTPHAGLTTEERAELAELANQRDCTREMLLRRLRHAH